MWERKRKAAVNKNNGESQVESPVTCNDDAKSGSRYSQQW